MPSASLLSDPVDYRDIKEWIAHQESLPQPAPLTDVQRKAIAELKASIIIKVPEPELGCSDCVSLLCRFRDANQEDNVVISFRDEAGPGGTWLCFCSYVGPSSSREPTEFPNRGSGFVADSRGTPVAPGFAKKKDAKRYAAKCCVDWLMQEDLIPRSGEISRRRKRSSPPPLFPATPSKSAAAAAAKKPGSTLGAQISAPLSGNTSPPSLSASADSDGEVPAIERVRDLCKYLNIVQPAYRVEASAMNAVGKVDFFDGWADFGSDAVTVPETVGRVTECLSKVKTKEKIAEEVLVYLIAEKARRDSDFRAVVGGGTDDDNDDDDDDVGSSDESDG
ncbi:hypothetical protein B0T25DRAFT_516927 [Lasiosphaeria hispida]|uniref:DRBM domain-containing protein n=1 Tax=Lasiosphaeria hispida TaxID=260671 RepID=A0AAJ0MGI1_9PEZI|nr:hypothetical protein B0T25DRAFT_516927 [Lasiosphaeria hispida]